MANLVIDSGIVTIPTIKALNGQIGDTLTITGSAAFPSDCSSMFKDTLFTTINIEISTAGVNVMTAMFAGCTHLETLNLGAEFDTSGVFAMMAMFADCSSLKTLNLGEKFDTTNVSSMQAMFINCTNLKYVSYEKNTNPRFITDGGLDASLTPHEDSPLGAGYWVYGSLSKAKKIIAKQGDKIVNHTFTSKTKIIVKYGHLNHPIAHQVTPNTRMIVKENGVIKSVPLL